MRTIVHPLAAVAVVSLVACSAAPPSETDDPTDPPSVATPIAQFDKVDLLLVVDNSISMAEKQHVLAKSVEGLLGGLVNPPCVDAAGNVIDQPETPAATCPSGSQRRAEPVRDLHVGVISSNLGALGGTACNSTFTLPADQAHLQSMGESGAVATYQDLGFLAWDPDQKLLPAGEASFDALVASTVEIVAGMGERGCGFEMPLEAMTRFLVDPAPYQTLELGADGVAVPTGVDSLLLAQRSAFLRPDSIVGVVLLSDENDCSLIPGQAHYLLDSEPFFRSTSACQVDANDACCTSCALPTPDGCSPDPSCQGEPRYAAAEDSPNLRCFDQKRRYGVDFHYPAARYQNALSAERIDPQSLSFASAEDGVENPLFIGDRQPQHVLFSTITGVPWQDLATNPADSASPLKTSEEMQADGTWAWLIGESGSPPTDPFMRESVATRSGVSPATGEDVAADNTINGGDRSIINHDDLQYACSFPLETPVEGNDCAYCTDATCDNPLCDGVLQIAGKAYPGTRQLELAYALGSRAVTGSICPPGAAPAANGNGGGQPEPAASRNFALPLEQLVVRMSELLPQPE